MSNLRTPLSQVKGLGSAKEGTDHFWMQRLTAIGLIPLVVWIAFSVARLPSMSQADIQTWLSSPFSAVMMTLFLIAAFWHAKMGLQVVIEDYVGNHAVRTVAIIAVTLICFALGVTGVFSVLHMAFTG
jgi:succinate dehydrogenase / fumarate reductase, membrane anchor subunit